MGTRAQIDVMRSGEIVRLYASLDGFPRNILPALRAAASEGRKTPFRIAQAIVRQLPEDFIEIIDDDQSEWVSYHFKVDVSSKPWRVCQIEAAGVVLPRKPDGSLDDSNEAFDDPKNQIPAVVRNIRIG
jgi:hypothetical protein